MLWTNCCRGGRAGPGTSVQRSGRGQECVVDPSHLQEQVLAQLRRQNHSTRRRVVCLFQNTSLGDSVCTQESLEKSPEWSPAPPWMDALVCFAVAVCSLGPELSRWTTEAGLYLHEPPLQLPPTTLPSPLMRHKMTPSLYLPRSLSNVAVHSEQAVTGSVFWNQLWTVLAPPQAPRGWFWPL